MGNSSGRGGSFVFVGRPVKRGSMPVSPELLNMLLMLHLDAGGGGMFREVVRARRREGGIRRWISSLHSE